MSAIDVWAIQYGIDFFAPSPLASDMKKQLAELQERINLLEEQARGTSTEHFVVVPVERVLEYKRMGERLRADREALEAAKERIQAHNRGSTHYEGCAADHPDCAAIRLIEARLESNDDQS